MKPTTKHGAFLLKKHSFFKLAALSLIAASFFSCKSTPDLAPVDAFELLDSDAALYLTVPVQANQEFVTAAVRKIANVAESDAQKIAERLDTAYIAIDSKNELQLSASGNIPTSFVGLALSEKNGWQAGAVEGQLAYTHKQTGYQLCLPSSSNAFLSRDISPMVEKFNRIAYADFPAEKVPAEVAQNSENQQKLLSETIGEKQFQYLHEKLTGDIMLYSPNPRIFIKNFIGALDVNTSVTSVYANLSQYRGVKEQFNVKMILNLADARTVKATIALLKVGFFGSAIPAKVVQTGQSQITITDLPVTQAQLLSVLR